MHTGNQTITHHSYPSLQKVPKHTKNAYLLVSRKPYSKKSIFETP